MPPQLYEFHLPLSPEDLLKSGGVNQYVVQEVLPIRQLQPQLKAFQAAFRAQGPLAILQHFDTVYSILHHFRSVDVGLKEETLEFLIKVVSRHSQELPAILEDAGLSGPDRRAHLNALKMNCYALIRLLEALETARSQESLADLDAGAKGKKARSRAAAGFEWEEERQPVLQLLTQLLQLDIRHLWKHSVIEEEFVSLVTGCGYRLLENPAIGHQRNRPTREAIAHLLGVALTRYNHMLSATVKVIQMLQHFEHLAPVLVAAVSLWATEYGMKSVVGEIVREMGEKCPQEPGRDPGRARGFAAFLTELAERLPAVLMSSVCVLLDHLDGENYVMRNAVLAAMAEMVLQVLRGDELEAAARATRDQFLDTLQAHGHDVHSFVRSRVLQLFTRIVQQKALPLTRFQAVVALAVGRLADKSVLVCKNAIQLLASFVANNPFSCKLSDADLAAPLQKETQKLEEMRAQLRAKAPALEPEEEWEAMLPELRATLRGLLAPPTEDEEDEGDEGAPEPVGPIADGEGAAQVTARIRQLLARASYRQAVLLAREAARRFPDAEPFRDDEDPAQDTPEGAAEEPPEDTPEGAEGRLLRLLGRVFKGPARGTRGPDRGPADGAAEAEAGPRGPPGDGGAELVKQELLVQYLRDAHSFARSLAQAVGAIGAMMYEHAATVVQEVIEFFVTVFRFGVPQAVGGVRRMLPLVWSKEPGVREAVLGAYRQLYLSPEGGSARARAQALIQNLSALLVGASAGALQCLEEILGEFVRQEEVPPAATQLLWERVAGKAPCAPGDRRAAVLLLGMMARGRPELVGSNLELLVSAGLAQGGRPDYRLAQQVCLAIANISDARKPTPGARAPPFRLPQDHRLFQRLRDMVTEGFAHPDPLWVPFKETAVALTYQLAEGPDALCAQMLQACARHALDSLEEGPEAGAPRLRAVLLLQLLSLAGDVALQQLLHLEQAVGAELGRRRALREEEGRAPPGPAAPEQGAGADTALEEELGLAGGASADDTEAELVRGICDTELLEGRQVLAAFAPLVVRVCQGPGVFGQPELCAAAALALGKFCMVSAAFCESQLRLVFTLLEKSAPPAARANLMAAAGDLAVRFPNLLDPWTPHLYARLRDPAPQVRKTAGLVLTHLILKDMVKVKGQVSEMAALLVDPEPPIAALARSFFHELSHKGNAIYNLLPDMVSRLSDPEGGVEEEPFRAIMRHLLGYITKEKQLESLVEKLCQRFRTAGTERQQRDLAFCVAQLPLGERGVRRLLELLPCLAGALGDPAVHAALLPLAARLRRGARPDARALADEFEQKLRACHTRGLDGADEPEPAAGTASQPAPPAKKRVPRPQPAASDDFATPEPRRAPRPPRTGRKKKPQVVFSSSDEASASDGELSAEMTEEETPKKTTPLRRASRRPRS